MGDVVWNGCNQPLWVPLHAVGTPPTPWLLRYRLQRMLQTGIADGMGMVFLG